MKRVYKYVLNPYSLVDEVLELQLPKNAKILSVAEQDMKMVLYALIDINETEIESRYIEIHGTGHDIQPCRAIQFIGTVKLMNGALMFHIFERIH